MKKILIFADYYSPGYKSGALRTVVNMVDRLGARFEFHVFTRNHDGGGDTTPYANVTPHVWTRVGNAQVFYAQPARTTLALIKQIVAEVRPDAIYLNSCFARMSLRFLLLRWVGNFRNIPLVVAPEAELMLNNMQIKSARKRLFCALTFPLGLFSNVIWKAASEVEAVDIRRLVGPTTAVLLAPNMPPRHILPNFELARKARKRSGHVRLVFVSRIMVKKNVGFAIERLRQVTGTVEFDIFGPIEDANYWAGCEAAISTLPANIRVTHKGPIEHERVAATVAEYDFFVLPTLGENFGHVALESFAAGCPLLISDQTPWRELAAQHIGWDMALDDESGWQSALQHCVDMGADEYLEWSGAARRYAVDWLAAPALEADNLAVLQRALGALDQ